MNRIQFLLKHLSGQKTRLILVFICVIFSSAISLLSSLIFGFVIDRVINGLENTNIILIYLEKMMGGITYIRSHLYLIFFVLIIVYFIAGILMYLRYRHQALVAENLGRNIRNDIYDHIQHLPYSYHVKAKTGDLVQRCTSDIDTIRRFFSGQIEEIVAILASASVAVTIMFSLNKKLALIASLSLPVIFFYSYLFFLKIQKLFLISDEKEADMTVNVQESLSGVRVIKAFNREKYVTDNFLKLSGIYRDETTNMLEALGSYWGSSYFICTLGILLIIVLGISYVRNGLISVGSFLVFVTYQSQILHQIRQLGRILSDFGKVMVSVDRLREVENTQAEDLEAGETPDLNGDIEFHHVSFKYDDDDYMVLKDIDLTIKKGQTVAILGPTGSGKSSLIHLLARLYDVESGQITINGHNINNIAKGYLREKIGIVLQESFLFSKSIYDNLTSLDPNIDSKAVERATRIASVHDVITNFDKGYNTLVGERGVTLSGGQKQRIAIARTLIRNTPILVFDDSLSAVDSQTDANIRNSLKALQNDATMIIITQRVNSAMDADMIFVIEDGKVSQRGNHEQLIQSEGLYKRIYEIQNKRMEEGLNV